MRPIRGVVLAQVVSFTVCLGQANIALADSFFDKFRDPEDGALDASAWLYDAKGFLPVPIIITEPAVGFGLGAAAVFFHESEAERARARKQMRSGGASGEPERAPPPSLSAAFGAYTDNGTWLAGGAHRGVWKDDSVRYTGALAAASINLTFYGIGDNTEPRHGDGLDFNGEGWFTLHEALFRVGESDFFLGGRFDYMEVNISFDDGDRIPGVPEDQLETTSTAGFGVLGGYDSRDNTFSPDSGVFAQAEAILHSGSFLGDFTYQSYNAKGLFYWPVPDFGVIGWRLDGRFARGDAPFYALPFIDLRGIPAMRYQGDDVLVTELEARWDFHNRWSLVGFGGLGHATDDFSELFDDDDWKATYGVGVRYLLARALGMRGGFDIARGPEDTTFYLQFGSAW